MEIADLKERVDLALAEREQQFTKLKEEALEMHDHMKQDVNTLREELRQRQQELGQAQEDVRAGVT